MVLFIVHDQALALDVSGPAEVFAAVNRSFPGPRPHYRLLYASAQGGLIPTASGLMINSIPLARIDLREIETVIVAGGTGVLRAAADAELTAWLGKAAPVVRRLCSVCTGAFILAAAGLLDGRRAVTHWSDVDTLQRDYPSVRVEHEPIFVKDGSIWTSAGVSAGIDMALALVSEDHGHARALQVARELVVFLQRPGNQAQFSRALGAQSRLGHAREGARLAELAIWIQEHLHEPLPVGRLAELAGMSERNFARRFAAQFHDPPARYVEKLRVDAASEALAGTSAPVKQVAAEYGFGDEERMRRAFLRCFGIAPMDYRRRFGPPEYPGTRMTSLAIRQSDCRGGAAEPGTRQEKGRAVPVEEGSQGASTVS